MQERNLLRASVSESECVFPDLFFYVGVHPLAFKCDCIYKHHYRIRIEVINYLLDHVVGVLVDPAVDLVGSLVCEFRHRVFGAELVLDVFDVFHVDRLAQALCVGPDCVCTTEFNFFCIVDLLHQVNSICLLCERSLPCCEKVRELLKRFIFCAGCNHIESDHDRCGRDHYVAVSAVILDRLAEQIEAVTSVCRIHQLFVVIGVVNFIQIERSLDARIVLELNRACRCRLLVVIAARTSAVINL